jgi:hypothetical protein
MTPVRRRSTAISRLMRTGCPGRGRARGKQHFLAALPHMDGRPSNDDLAGSVSVLANRVRGAWNGSPGRLPGMVPYEQLPTVDQQVDQSISAGTDPPVCQLISASSSAVIAEYVSGHVATSSLTT